jgi:ferrous iron transport protein B
MLITPFMSCSARLPVYILFISAFFASNQGTVLFLLYFLGALFAIISAFILKKVFFRREDIPFVMELPPYRMPTFRSIIRHVAFRTGLYLRKIGGIILIASVIVWFLSNFPRRVNYSRDYPTEIISLSNQVNDLKASQASLNNEDKINLLSEKEKDLAGLLAAKKGEEQAASFMGMIGHTISPLMKPLGFDWKLSIAILSGVAAKEVVVSTLGIMYQAGDRPDRNSLVEKIQDQKDEYGRKAFSPLIAFSFMLFILTYFPCIGVVAAIKRESASWKWAAFVVVYTTSIAWLLSFVVYQVGSHMI